MADYSYVIIGIPFVMPTKEVVSKIGEHDFPTDYKYHPQTGKALWKTTVIPVLEDSIIQSKGLEYIVDGDETYLGWILKNCWFHKESNYGEIPNLPALKADVKELLEPIGCWDEEAFGIYNVLKGSSMTTVLGLAGITHHRQS